MREPRAESTFARIDLAHDLPSISVQLTLNVEVPIPMGTHADSIAVKERHSEANGLTRDVRSIPQTGDVLASARAARADVYTISIVPAAAHLTASRHAEALEKVRELARGLEVDAWFTFNRTHYARVARFRYFTPSHRRCVERSSDEPQR